MNLTTIISTNKELQQQIGEANVSEKEKLNDFNYQNSFSSAYPFYQQQFIQTPINDSKVPSTLQPFDVNLSYHGNNNNNIKCMTGK